MNNIESLPGISEHLKNVDDNIPVTTENLEELICHIRAHTGLPEETVNIITRLFFQEIRNETLKGNTVNLKNIGKFSIFIPKENREKIRIHPKLKPSKNLSKCVNQINKK